MNTVDTLRDVHFSGKFSATADEMTAALDILAKTNDRIRLTEVGSLVLAKVLLEWAADNGWFLFHPTEHGPRECAILSRFKINATAAFPATRLGLKVGRKDPTFVTAARTKGWGWAAVLHTPAHTGGLRTTGKFAWATKVYRSVMEGVHQIRFKLGPWQTWSYDANGDLTHDKFRKVIEDALPGLRICTPFDQKPTEGGRVIDGHATNLDFEWSKTLHLPAWLRKRFDHSPVQTILHRTRRGKKK